MTKKAVKRVMKKKRKLKKQVKRKQQQEQQQMMRPPMMMGYGPQMYGNADGTMQQLRNQNQSTVDNLNSMSSALMTMKNELKKNEERVNEMSKQRKDVEHRRALMNKDLEIEQDREKEMEVMISSRETT